MRSIHKIALSAALGTSLFTAAIAAQAQPSTPPSTQSKSPAAHISDSQLKQFAHASEKVSQISHDAIKKLRATKDAEKQKGIRKKANHEMIQAVKNNGLSVHEYNLISKTVRSHPNLQKKLHKMLNS